MEKRQRWEGHSHTLKAAWNPQKLEEAESSLCWTSEPSLDLADLPGHQHLVSRAGREHSSIV